MRQYLGGFTLTYENYSETLTVLQKTNPARLQPSEKNKITNATAAFPEAFLFQDL